MGLLTKPNELTIKETYAGLIYGQPGVGKSTLALSGVNPVCIDIDRGMYRVEKRYQVPSLQVESYQQVLDLFNSSELDGFDTIVIDTLGKLIDCMGEYVSKNNPKYRQSNGQLTMQGWGQVKIEFHALVKLISGKNKSVIFVAHESEEKEGDVTKKRPDVSGSARKDIVKELDFMGYMEMSGNKRTISFSPSSAYYAKNSMGLDAVIEIPGIQTANSFIRDVVVSAIKNRKEQDQAQAGPYDEVIKKIDDLVNAAKDTAALNEVCGKLTTMDHIWDSKLYAWSKINEAAKTINATWDKAAKRFMGPAIPKQEVPVNEHNPTTSGNEGAVPPPPPPKNLEQQCHDEMVKIGNIMMSVSETGERYFTDDEVKAVKVKLSSFSKSVPEFRFSLTNKLLGEQKNLLQERIKFFKDIGFEESPSSEPEGVVEAAAEDDGFMDDIPYDPSPGKPGKNPSRSWNDQLQQRIKNQEAAEAKVPVATEAGEELDIF
jgi:hypothetical protein